MALHHLLAKNLSLQEAGEVVSSALALILERCNPYKVYLFGSAARGELTDHSDLDFVVVLKEVEDIREARKAFYGTPRKLKLPLDVIFVSEAMFEKKSIQGGVFFVARSEGKLLFEVISCGQN